MSSVPMPRDLSEDGLRVWVRDLAECDLPPDDCFSCRRTARAVLALCEAKVREAVKATDPQDRMMQDEIVARVMGKEAPK